MPMFVCDIVMIIDVDILPEMTPVVNVWLNWIELNSEMRMSCHTMGKLISS